MQERFEVACLYYDSLGPAQRQAIDDEYESRKALERAARFGLRIDTDPGRCRATAGEARAGTPKRDHSRVNSPRAARNRTRRLSG
jgi:hypothetical protein